MALPPDVGAFDAPTTQFEVNDAWLTHLFELVGRAARLSFWEGTEAQQIHAVHQVEAIVTAMMIGNIKQVVGEIRTHVLSTLPDNWLWCDGATYNRVDYPELYAAIHENFKISADQFEVPNLELKFPYGTPEGSNWEGIEGGEAAHVLTTSEMPTHSHGWTAANHTQVLSPTSGTTGLRVTGVAASGFYLQPNGGTGTANAGGGFAHNNLPPYSFTSFAIVARS